MEDGILGIVVGFIFLCVIFFAINKDNNEIKKSEKISVEVEFVDAYTKTEGGGVALPDSPVVVGNSTDFVTVIKYENTYYEFRDKTTYYNAKSFNQENGKVYGNFAKTKNGLRLLEIVFNNNPETKNVETTTNAASVIE